MKKLYPEIRWVKDIRKIHIQGFIYLNLNKWTYKTRETYKNYFTKLVIMIDKIYHIKINIDDVYYGLDKPKTKIKNNPMKTEDFIIFSDIAFNRRSKANLAPLLVATLGCRLEELCSIKPEEIDLTGHRVYLTNCKNGRNRDLYIRDEFYFLWKFIKLKAEKFNYKTIFGGILPNSCMRFLYLIKRDNNLMDKYPYESCHSIRKMFAQRRFSEELLKGFSVEESWLKVQRELGHGKLCREELFKTYVGFNYKKFKEEYSRTKQPPISQEEIERQINHIRSYEEALNSILENL